MRWNLVHTREHCSCAIKCKLPASWRSNAQYNTTLSQTGHDRTPLMDFPEARPYVFAKAHAGQELITEYTRAQRKRTCCAHRTYTCVTQCTPASAHPGAGSSWASCAHRCTNKDAYLTRMQVRWLVHRAANMYTHSRAHSSTKTRRAPDTHAHQHLRARKYAHSHVHRLVVCCHARLFDSFAHGGVAVACACHVLAARAVLHSKHALCNELSCKTRMRCSVARSYARLFPQLGLQACGTLVAIAQHMNTECNL